MDMEFDSSQLPVQLDIYRDPSEVMAVGDLIDQFTFGATTVAAEVVGWIRNDEADRFFNVTAVLDPRVENPASAEDVLFIAQHGSHSDEVDALARYKAVKRAVHLAQDQLNNQDISTHRFIEISGVEEDELWRACNAQVPHLDDSMLWTVGSAGLYPWQSREISYITAMQLANRNGIFNLQGRQQRRLPGSEQISAAGDETLADPRDPAFAAILDLMPQVTHSIELRV